MTSAREKALQLLRTFREQVGPLSFRRALAAAFLFDFIDRLRAWDYPADWIQRLESEMTKLVASLNGLSDVLDRPASAPVPADAAGASAAVAQRTGEVYFNLWKDLTPDEYYRQALDALRERFSKNGLSVQGVAKALDAGCGGGRYTLALKALGCAAVTGIDVSANSVELARSKNAFPDSEVSFVQGSVLELPFASGSFDFVFSNGVLHHTTDTARGLRELRRVLRPGGCGWLYLYGGKDTFFWDVVDSCRSLLEGVPQSYTQDIMRLWGYPPGRIFHRNDFFYVPIHHRYLAAEVEDMLRQCDFAEYRRLHRGVEIDWDEIIFSHPSIDPYLFGEGEMRYWLQAGA